MGQERERHGHSGGLDCWDRLLLHRDDKRVWQAISWKGTLNDSLHADSKPTDEEFKLHYDNLLDVATADPANECRDLYVTIPLLDDPISYTEVSSAQVNKIKADKACGPDGIAPGVFKLLPVYWITFIVTLFNGIFINGQYPMS